MQGFRPSGSSQTHDKSKVDLNRSLCYVSSGSPQIDYFLDGGIPVGSLILLIHDAKTLHHQHLLLSFLAEGAKSNHDLTVISSSKKLINTLSTRSMNMDGPIKSNTSKYQSDHTEKNIQQNPLRIAWRYQYIKSNLTDPNIPTRGARSMSRCADLLKSYPIEFITTDLSESLNTKCIDYLKSLIVSTCHSNSKTPRITRMVLDEISYDWFETLTHTTDREIFGEISKFCWTLRSQLRTSPCVAFASISNEANQELLEVLTSAFDFVMKIKCFDDAETSTSSSLVGYNGTVTFSKTSNINHLVSDKLINFDDLVYKMTSGEFTISKYHLPPAYDDDQVTGTGCSSAVAHKPRENLRHDQPLSHQDEF